MKHLLALFVWLVFASCVGGATPRQATQEGALIDRMMTLYDFQAVRHDGQTLSLDMMRGKVVLVVNTASKCGFTPQYKELEEAYERFHEAGFEILDFPCNQFGGQSPESDAETVQFCQLNYKTRFPQMRKVEVNGPNRIPLYVWLTSQRGFQGFDLNHKLGKLLDSMLSKADPDYASKSDIKWNFTKFLINRQGEVVARYEPTTSMEEVTKAIEKAL